MSYEIFQGESEGLHAVGKGRLDSFDKCIGFNFVSDSCLLTQVLDVGLQ